MISLGEREPWLFPASRKNKGVLNPISPANWLKRVLKPAAAELGLAVDLRMFRRGFATIADSEGGSLKEIQQQLRHASVATTANVYVQPVPSNVRAMVEKVDRVLGSLAGKDQRPVPILMTPG